MKFEQDGRKRWGPMNARGDQQTDTLGFVAYRPSRYLVLLRRDIDAVSGGIRLPIPILF